MKHRAIISAAAIAVLAAACLPAMNWAQSPAKNSTDEGDNPFSAKQLAKHEKQLQKQEEELRVQADEMRIHAEFAAKEAHKVAEQAQIKFRSIFRGPGNPRLMTEINEQATKYRDADNEEDKSTAMKNLNEVVDKCFEDDMKVRENELADIEERLNKLRAQLDRRRAKKQEIVDLQVKVAINEAEGLGFFSESKSDVFKFRVPAPVRTPFEARAWSIEPFAAVDATPPSADVAPAPVAVPAPPAPPVKTGIHGRVIEVGPPVLTSTSEGTLTINGSDLSLTAPPTFDRRPLSLGAEGDLVRLLQFQLNARLDPSPNLDVDADFGPATEQAVKDFQKQEDLEVTGIVDEATRKELDRRN